jgi:hypothetical protein
MTTGDTITGDPFDVCQRISGNRDNMVGTSLYCSAVKSLSYALPPP